MGERLRSARRAAVRIATAPWRFRAEVLHAGAILGGWALLTWGVAALLRVWQVWPISGGLLLLSLAGWVHLRLLFAAGLYRLTRKSG